MPTLPAPQNSPNLPYKQSSVSFQAPPKAFSSSQPPKSRDSMLAAVLFIIALLLLCGLIGYFVFKSSNAMKLAAPVLSQLPAITSKSSLLVEGTGPKNATIDLVTESKTVVIKADKTGRFSETVSPSAEGKVTYFATARKKFLFWTLTSDRSNEVFTVVDRTAPNLKLVTPPNTVVKSDYTLKGTTSEPSTITVKINDIEKTVSTDGKNAFSLQITLKRGANSIKVTAKDAAGNETASANISVTFQTGTVYTNGTSRRTNGNLPDSAGELSEALNSVFGRTVGIIAVIIGGLGFLASNGIVWLVKNARHEA